MTGSALSKSRQVQAVQNVSCREKEMILRRTGGGGGMCRGSEASSGTESADDGKRFVEVPLGTSCAERCVRCVWGGQSPSRRGSGGGGRRDSPPVGPIGGFFLSGFSLRFPLFWAREGFQVEVYVGPMLELVLGGVLEASWSDLGRFLGGQDAPKTSQDGAKTGQVGVKTG